MRSLLLMASVLLFPGTSFAEPSENRTYSATAYRLDGAELIYTEHHNERWADGRLTDRTVRYEDAQGELIAEKEVRYGEVASAPSFDMIDHRTGLREGANVAPETVELYSGKKKKLRTVDRPIGAVIDAGFDAFLRENFAAVAAGETVEFEFAVPALHRFIRFAVELQGRVEHAGEPALLVRMRPAMVVLRWLVDPLELVYSLDGSLLEFRGLSNICGESGSRYKARITFDYSGLSPTVGGRQ